ncbi:hypothetical protein BRARA_D00348 [Brassica rapa]|uniref:DUF7804 domain-containing protein n=2 Tax=Brassica campestris TaxID=3711 RepID=A0A397ZJE5_BRACM|nr:hypothetical protein IGI04_014428 [Brassica rapa subsp. trilocularis]RID65128.1 hypothetical protein BRARA_D00348 [Brassica rapa]CAG7905521.1 unnamed protein product [Brassica rapa]VDD10727.1 unnamed protein product [Brassica rapa]
MASICCGGGGGSACAVRCDRRTVTPRASCVSVPVTNRRNRTENGKVSMTMADFAPVKPERKRGGSVVSREKLDEWLRDSVVEIVRNLRESSLMVNLYAEGNGGLTTTATATNPAAEDWEAMEGRWGRGEERTPEGVVLVEKLADGEVAERDDYDGGACGEGATSAWGIVAQGRGTDSGPVCYLLKTTRVGSGVGTVCTHFSLVKVKSFRETAVSQLNNSWLVQTGQ